MIPTPPPRAPHYYGNECYGWTLRDCAIGLIDRLGFFVREPIEFRGDVSGRIWHFQGDYDDRAQFLFNSDRGDGRIELTIEDSCWVRAELFIGEELKLRAWLEDPYEEKAFWPDGGDGVDEAPGRISKNGLWLNIERARFPGAWDKDKPFIAIETGEPSVELG